MSKGKVAIFRKNKQFKVDDRGFSKVSFIPDTILLHSIPEENCKEDGEDTECKKNTVRKWYSEKVFYSVKDMVTQNSSALRGAKN